MQPAVQPPYAQPQQHGTPKIARPDGGTGSQGWVSLPGAELCGRGRQSLVSLGREGLVCL